MAVWGRSRSYVLMVTLHSDDPADESDRPATTLTPATGPGTRLLAGRSDLLVAALREEQVLAHARSQPEKARWKPTTPRWKRNAPSLALGVADASGLPVRWPCCG